MGRKAEDGKETLVAHGPPSDPAYFSSRGDAMITVLLPIALLAASLQSPFEERFAQVQGAVLVKLQKLRDEKVEPTKAHFKDELAQLEDLARAAHPAEPETELAILLFEANLLGDQLRAVDDAIACY